MRRSARRALVMMVTIAAAAGAGCSDSSSAPPDVDDLRGEFGGDTVDAAIGLLADANIEVRVRPDDDAEVDVENPSAVALLRFQVRNLALEANVGGGALGGDLDTVSAEAGGGTVSYLIVGWALTAGTPAANAAAALLGDIETVDPRRVTFPGLVLALFLGDISGPADAPETTAAGFRRAPSAGDEGDDFCADVSAYLSGALSGIVGSAAPLEPRWLSDVIDRYAPFESDPHRLRNAVAAMSLYVYATSIAKPWVPLLVSNPLGGFHHVVGESEIPPTTEIRLSVDTGDEFIAEEAAECAALAGLQLADAEVEGSDVLWRTEGLLPHAKIDSTGPGGDPELDENGSAVWEFEPIMETTEAHRRGTLQTATIPVGAVILQRDEIADVRNVVRDLIVGGDLGAAAPEVVAMFERLEPIMDRLLYPRATTTATVTWHTPKPPDEDENGIGQGGNGCGTGCAASNGDPHLVPLSGTAYDFQAAGEFVLLRSADEALEVQARHVPVGDDRTVTLNAAIAARIGEHRLGIYAAGSGVEIRLDGESIALDEEVDLGDGARLAPYEHGIEVTFPDGTVMYAVPRRLAVEIMVNPSDGLREGGVGLLGRSAREGYGLPLLPDGSAVRAPDDRIEAFELLYGDYEEAWRVTDETSLFDYEDGESPDSFLVDDFPVRPLEYEDLTPDQIAIGDEACANVELADLRRSCIVDVVVTGDASFAEMYETSGLVIENASDGLGLPGPLIEAAPVESGEPEPDSTTSVITTPEPEALDAVESMAGEPSLTLEGSLVALYSELAFDDGVVSELRGAISAAEGTVLLARVDACPPGAMVFMDVVSFEYQTSIFAFPCDPGDTATMTMREGDEYVPGESYVWLSAAGDYEVLFSTNSETPVPISVELYADPSPTIVEQAAALDGDVTTLSGIGDTLVYTFDGTSPDPVSFTAEGLTEACAVDAYAAPEVGTGEMWWLHFCGHTTTPGGGLADAGFYVPVIVFARTGDEIQVELTPTS